MSIFADIRLDYHEGCNSHTCKPEIININLELVPLKCNKSMRGQENP